MSKASQIRSEVLLYVNDGDHDVTIMSHQTMSQKSSAVFLYGDER